MFHQLCAILGVSAVAGYNIRTAQLLQSSQAHICPRVALAGTNARSQSTCMQAPAAAPPDRTHTPSGDSQTKKIVVLGGDGFCGWPSAVHLSDKGHEVIIIDNLSRRKIDVELGCGSLTPIVSPEERVAAWHELTGKTIRYEYMDIALEYDRFTQFLKDEEPDTIVHFAEQRAAPYSMRNAACKR